MSMTKRNRIESSHRQAQVAEEAPRKAGGADARRQRHHGRGGGGA